MNTRGGRVPVQRADLLQSSDLHVNPTMTRINYARWLLRVLTWDTLLPVGISILPRAIDLVLPNQPRVIDFASVIAPIVAFFLRLRAGGQQISSNQCSELVQGWQAFVFCFAIFPLVLVDALLILWPALPKGGRNIQPGDWMILIYLSAFYLTGMVIAMYPGRSPATTRSWSHGER